MQMLGWLHSKPKDSSQSNIERYPDVKMPYVPDECLHLLDILEEIGIAKYDGMGVSRIGWAEINSWSVCTGMKLQAKEVKALSIMSAAYAAQINSKDEFCPVDDDNSIRESIDMVNIKAMIEMASQ